MAQAAICSGINEPLEVIEVGVDPPKAGEVRVRMGASGVCHSDLSVVNGTLLSPLPSVLGHEGAGIVEEVGDGVTSVKPGDHVVLSFVPQCGQCYFCTHDTPEMCETGFMAMAMGGQLDMTPRFNRGGVPLHQMSGLGTFSEELVCPEISTVKIDPDVPFTRAALIGCGVLTGFGAAANTADIAQGRHGRRHRLRRRRPERDPGREVQGRGAHHRDRPVRLQARDGEQFGATDLVNAEQRRHGRAGAGAHRRARRRRLVRGDRPEGDGRSRRSRWRGAAVRRSSSAFRRWNRSWRSRSRWSCSSTRSRCAGRGTAASNVQRDVPRLIDAVQGRHAQARRARVAHDRSRRHQRRVPGDGSGRGRPIRRRLRDLTTTPRGSCRHRGVVVRYRRFGTAISSSRRSGSARGRSSPTGGAQSDDPHEMIKAALDAGINFIDTAPVYGDDGAGETILARLPRRATTTSSLTTKVGYDITAERKFPGQSERPHDWRPESVRQQCEDSLRRLGARPHRPVPAAQPAHRADPRRRPVGDARRLAARGQGARARRRARSRDRMGRGRQPRDRRPPDRVAADGLQRARAGAGPHVRGPARASQTARSG